MASYDDEYNKYKIIYLIALVMNDKVIVNIDINLYFTY